MEEKRTWRKEEIKSGDWRMQRKKRMWERVEKKMRGREERWRRRREGG